MKENIYGTEYDTETAEEIYADNGETLYRKKTGGYFLCGDTTVPLLTNAARAWAECRMTTAEYEAEFGPVSDLKKEILGRSADLLKAVQKMVAEGASYDGLITIQAELAELMVAYGRMRGREEGRTEDADTWDVDALNASLALQLRSFNWQVPEGMSLLVLASHHSARAADLVQIAYLEGELAAIRAAKEDREAKE